MEKVSYSDTSKLLRLGGLASGLDTNNLIESLMLIERIPISRTEGQKQLLSFQQTKLQDINLKLFNLRNKATDLTFSKAFNSKTSNTTNPSLFTATATTSAKIGSYRIEVDQVATASTVKSKASISNPLQKGRQLSGTKALDGLNIKAGNEIAGLTGIDFSISLDGGEEFLDLTTLNNNSSFGEIKDRVNSQISSNIRLNGKVKLDYDQKNGNLKFVNTGTGQLTFQDKTGNFLGKAFDNLGNFSLDSTNTIRTDQLNIKQGTSQTLSELGVTLGSFDIDLNGGGPQNIDISTLTGNSTIGEALNLINARIEDNGTLAGKVRGVFDPGIQKIKLELTDTFDKTSTLQFTDNAGDFIANQFGGASIAAGLDAGQFLAIESFGETLTSGTFTLDGVQLSVNGATDTLGDVLTRITNSTNINATYDSLTDRVKLTQKDGSSKAIGIGSGNDTSNLLNLFGLTNNNQNAAASLSSQGNIGTVSAFEAVGAQLNSILGDFSTPLVSTNSGVLDVTVNGKTTQVSYNSSAGGDTLQNILDRIQTIDGIDSALYDPATGKISVKTDKKGSQASLKIAENATSGGNLASALKIGNAEIQGEDIGAVLEGNRPLSRINTALPLTTLNLIEPVTSGTFTLNGKQIAINNSEGFGKVIEAINNSGAGVKASYDLETNGILLTATSTGNQSIQIGAATDTSNFLQASGLNRGDQEIGKNTIYRIDGGPTQTTTTTLVSDAIEGVTLNLFKATSGGGETLTIASNTEETKKTILEFVADYNAIAVDIDAELSAKRDYSLSPLTDLQKEGLSESELETYEESLKTGLLANDPTLKMVQRKFRELVFGSVDGISSSFNSLAQIGLSSGAVGAASSETKIGKIEIVDPEKFDKALSENIDEVKALFSQDGSDSDSKGIARRIKDIASEFSDFDGILTRRVGRAGSVTNSEMDRQILRIEKSILEQQAALFKKEDALVARFSRLEQAMSKITSSGEQLLASFAQQSK